jgi:hypothetical protein
MASLLSFYGRVSWPALLCDGRYLDAALRRDVHDLCPASGRSSKARALDRLGHFFSP